MAKRKYLSDEQKQYIIQELKRKVSVNKIKQVLHTSSNVLKRVIKEHKIPYDSKDMQRHKGIITNLSQNLFIKNSSANNCRINKFIRDHNIIDSTKCWKCEITEWQDQPIVLELHHVNGVHSDFRLINLCYLCPNCHSQTKTFRYSENQGREKVKEEDLVKALKSTPNIRRALQQCGLTPRGANYERAYQVIGKHNIQQKNL